MIGRWQPMIWPNLANSGHHLAVGECLRANGVDDLVPCAGCHLHGSSGQIIHVDWLELVVTGSEHPKNRQMTERPSYVVDQHVLLPEEDSWPQDTVGEAKAYERLLQLRLPQEIRQVRVDVRIGDADVDDPTHSGVLGRIKHGLCVSDGSLMREQFVVKTDPVGVDQHVRLA